MTTTARAIFADQLQPGMVYAVPEDPGVQKRVTEIRRDSDRIYILGVYEDPIGGPVGQSFGLNRPLFVLDAE